MSAIRSRQRMGADASKIRARAIACALASTALLAPHAVAAVPDALRAIESGDCKGAGTAINEGMARDDAQAYFLAGYLFDGTGCVVNDPARAARYYQRAAELGDSDAPAFLGLLHGLGRGVPQDYAAAYRWFTFARRGDAIAAIDPEQHRVAGYAMTVAHLARGKVRYPILSERDSIEATLTAIFDPSSGRVSFERARAGVEVGSNVPKTRPFVDVVSTAYAAAIAEAPSVDGVEKTSLRFATPWTFAMRRGRQDEKLQGRGEANTGPTDVLK